MKRWGYRQPAGAVVMDVVVYGGDVEIRGEVRGSVFVADGDVVLRDKAIVRGNITVIDEDLVLETGSTVMGSVLVVGGEIKHDEGASVGGEITVKKEELPYESRWLFREYLVFDRPIPNGLPPEQALNELSGAMRDWRRAAISPWTSPAGLPAIELPREAVESARMMSLGRGEWEMNIWIVQLDSPDKANGLWKQIYSRWNSDKLSRAVLSSLCGGAHWFFMSDTRAVAIWTRGEYLMLITVAPPQGQNAYGHIAEFIRDDAVSRMSRKWNTRNH